MAGIFDTGIFDTGIYDTNAEVCLFDSGIFDTGIFDHCTYLDGDTPVGTIGGNWYPRPIIYLDDDGKEVDLREYKRRIARQKARASDNEKAALGLDDQRKLVADRVEKIEAQIDELGAKMRKARKQKKERLKLEIEAQRQFLDKLLSEAEFIAAEYAAAYERFVADQRETALRVIMIDDMITQDENAMIADLIALAQQSGLIAA